MIYNINLGIGWASSGVEYAQSYRASCFRNLGVPSKFIFTDMITYEHIEHMTKNIGFLDDEVIWLYMYFTDFKMTPVTYKDEDLIKTFPSVNYSYSRQGKIGRYTFDGNGNFYTVYYTKDDSNLIHRVEIVSNGYLIRKDYFTYKRLFSEYYAPFDDKAHLYLRRFFNEDGSIAYEEINDDDKLMYVFKDQIITSKEEFVAYFIKCLKLKDDDIVIVDRTTGIGQAVFMAASNARIGIVIHADHFSSGSTNDDYILWNNYYEYPFMMHKHIAFFICATDCQSELFKEQFKKYVGSVPLVYTIPVGSLDKLRYPSGKRKPFSIITASRLASEKHIDWLVEAVALAKKEVKELSLDIYGKGGEEELIKKKIDEHGAFDYIHLMGQQNLKEVYQNYELYLAASTSEGFGLTLMEAVGGGLPIVGFDVRYGNPTFIDDGENGYLIEYDENDSIKNKVNALAKAIVKVFKESDLDKFHKHSYDVASRFLSSEVERKWSEAIK